MRVHARLEVAAILVQRPRFTRLGAALRSVAVVLFAQRTALLRVLHVLDRLQPFVIGRDVRVGHDHAARYAHVARGGRIRRARASYMVPKNGRSMS